MQIALAHACWRSSSSTRRSCATCRTDPRRRWRRARSCTPRCGACAISHSRPGRHHGPEKTLSNPWFGSTRTTPETSGFRGERALARRPLPISRFNSEGDSAEVRGDGSAFASLPDPSRCRGCVRSHLGRGTARSWPNPSEPSAPLRGRRVAPPPAAAGRTAAAPTPVYRGPAPGVEGLTRAIAKAHGAVAKSQHNAQEQSKPSAASRRSPAIHNDNIIGAAKQSPQASRSRVSQPPPAWCACGTSTCTIQYLRTGPQVERKHTCTAPPARSSPKPHSGYHRRATPRPAVEHELAPARP